MGRIGPRLSRQTGTSDGIIVKPIPGKSLDKFIKEIKESVTKYNWEITKSPTKSEDASKILIGFKGPGDTFRAVGKELKKVLSTFKKDGIIKDYKLGFGFSIPESWLVGFRRSKRSFRLGRFSFIVYRGSKMSPEAVKELKETMDDAVRALDFRRASSEARSDGTAVKIDYIGPAKDRTKMRAICKKVLNKFKKKEVIKDYFIGSPYQVYERFQKGGAAETINVMLVPVPGTSREQIISLWNVVSKVANQYGYKFVKHVGKNNVVLYYRGPKANKKDVSLAINQALRDAGQGLLEIGTVVKRRRSRSKSQKGGGAAKQRINVNLHPAPGVSLEPVWKLLIKVASMFDYKTTCVQSGSYGLINMHLYGPKKNSQDLVVAMKKALADIGRNILEKYYINEWTPRKRPKKKSKSRKKSK